MSAIQNLWRMGCALLVATSPGIAYPHHSLALYSRETTEMVGEIVGVEWRNPHISFGVRTSNADGRDERWTLEAATIYSLERRGIQRDVFAIGERIRVAGRLSMRQERTMWVDNMLFTDGREILVDGGSTPRWSMRALGSVKNQQRVDAQTENVGLFRVWSQSLLGERGTQSFDYRVEAQRYRQWREMQSEFSTRCESLGMPAVMMGTPYPIQLIDHGATIQLLGLSNNAQINRTIHMGGQTPPAAQTHGRMGYSTGRWDGNVLVVNTSKIDWPYFLSGVLHEKRIETVEWFFLSEDQSRLDYQITVIAPDILSHPGTATEHYVALGERLVEPSNCRP